MTALEWLRSKATPLPTETMIVTAEEAATVNCPAGRYRIETFVFRGTVPYRMREELKKVSLERNETVSEILRIGGGGYKSESCKVEFHRNVCTLEEAAA